MTVNTICYGYPDQKAHNTETLMYDNVEQMFYIADKVDGVCHLYKLPFRTDYGTGVQRLAAAGEGPGSDDGQRTVLIFDGIRIGIGRIHGGARNHDILHRSRHVRRYGVAAVGVAADRDVLGSGEGYCRR